MSRGLYLFATGCRYPLRGQRCAFDTIRSSPVSTCAVSPRLSARWPDVYKAFEDARIDVEALSASLPALYPCKGAAA